MKLSACISRRSSNLQMTRFVAAILVILAHAYILCTGSNENDWFVQIFNGQITMGYAAVAIFFFCSGLLIAKSVERFKKATSFFRTRFLKIFPPLIFVVILTMMAGSFITTLDKEAYWTSGETWKYLLNSVLLPQHNLPGVFEQAPYVPTVNGALWTLPVEFLCYAGCFVVYKVGMLTKEKFPFTLPLVILFVVGVNLIEEYIPILQAVLSPCLFFYIGMVCYVYREYIVLRWKYAAFAAVLLFIFAVMGALVDGMYILLPYILLVCWYNERQIPEKFASLGSISYGMYLWGFPVQQFLIFCFDNKMRPMENVFMALPITILLGILTYCITEKRCALRKQ